MCECAGDYEGYVIFCPLHNAATDMLEALKNVAMDLQGLKDDAQSASVRSRASASLKCIKAVIKAAEGR